MPSCRPALRREFGELQAAMSRVAPVGNETRVRASVQKMSPHEAAGHAATIVKLYVELMNGVERAEPLKVVAPPRKPPRFLTGRLLKNLLKSAAVATAIKDFARRFCA